MKKGILVLLAVALTALPVLGMSAPGAQVSEAIYLADSAGSNDNTSHIYRVDINGGQANLTLVVTLGPGAAGPSDPGWNNVDVLGCTADGKHLYGIDNSSSAPDTDRLFRYDIDTDTVTDLGQVVEENFNTDQGAIAPDGTFYITRNENESLYYINLSAPGAPTATYIAQIRDKDTGALINVQGGDIAFGTGGVLYMVTYKPPMSLYVLTNWDRHTRNPAEPVWAEYKGVALASGSYNGIAVLAAGWGDLLGSSPSTDSINEISKADGSILASYPVYLSGTRMDLRNGDMTTGPLVLCTRTIGYWKNHSWDGNVVTINGETITEAIGRGPAGVKPGTGILWQARGNNFSMLYAQLIAAKLNVLNASGNKCIDEAEAFLAEAGITLATFDAEFASKQQKKVATKYVKCLDDFNNSIPCTED